MGMRMNFLCGDGYGITKPVPARPVAIPNLKCLMKIDEDPLED